MRRERFKKNSCPGRGGAVVCPSEPVLPGKYCAVTKREPPGILTKLRRFNLVFKYCCEDALLFQFNFPIQN